MDVSDIYRIMSDIVIKKIHKIVGQDISKIDALIVEMIQGHVPVITQVTKHLLGSGGKRLRPALTLLSARLLNYTGSSHIGVATSIELIHTSTLIHDDVVDDSSMRRGKATANTIWSNRRCILVGDFLLSQAFKILVQEQCLRTLEVVAKTSAIIAEGEIKQINSIGNLDITFDEYKDIIYSKTASLFGTACQIGAILNKSSSQIEESMLNFGVNLGIAFQIVDDVLDYTNTLGKNLGDDFHEGKMTLPIIVAYQYANTQEKKFWKRTISQHDIQDGDLQLAIEQMHKYDVVTICKSTILQFIDEALKSIDIIPDNHIKDLLRELPMWIIRRINF